MMLTIYYAANERVKKPMIAELWTDIHLWNGMKVIEAEGDINAVQRYTLSK